MEVPPETKACQPSRATPGNPRPAPFFAAMRLPAPLLASAFAKTCGARLVGPDQYIHGVNEIHRVEPGDLTFVDHPKYYASTLASAASVVLIDREPEGGPPAGKTVLVHPEPFAPYDALVREHRPPYVLSEPVARSASVHASAVVEPGAIVGPKVTIGPYTRVEAGAVIYGPARIGAHCRIGAGTVVGDLAFYFRGVPGADAPEAERERGRRRWTTGGDVVLEDYVELGPNCVVARGVSATTRIGAGTKVDAGCMIAHGVEIGRDCLLAAQVGIAGKARIGDGCVLYGQAGVAQNVVIGPRAVISAKAGVSKDLAGGQTYFGAPAEPIRSYMRKEATLRRLARG